MLYRKKVGTLLKGLCRLYRLDSFPVLSLLMFKQGIKFRVRKSMGGPSKKDSILPISTRVEAMFYLLYKQGSKILLPDRNFSDVRNYSNAYISFTSNTHFILQNLYVPVSSISEP